MITITRKIEEVLYISDEELEKRARRWDMTIEEIITDLQNGELTCDDFECFSDYTVESEEISID